MKGYSVMLVTDATVEPERQSPTVGRKRHHDSEEARRADICAAYLKRFKALEPRLMAEIATEHQLQLP